MPIGDQYSWNLGSVKLDHCDEYKYLGEIISNTGSLIPHLKVKENQINAMLSQTFSVCSDSVLNQIKTELLFKVYETCMVPCLIYGCETWTLNKQEEQYMLKIQRNILRKILKVPESSPSSAVYLDTGIFPISFQVERRQLAYFWKLANSSDGSLCSDIFMCQMKYKSHKQNWANYISSLLLKYKLDNFSIENIANMNWKMTVKRLLHNEYTKKLLQQDGTKLKDLVMSKNSIGREEYMKNLPMKYVRILFISRCKMFPCKENFKGTYNNDLLCRLCKMFNENQDHLFQECEITRHEHFKKSNLFCDDINILKDIAEKLLRISELFANV